jgi:hypothetical protein
MQSVIDTIASFVQGVLNFFTPVVIAFSSLLGFVGFIVAALANPQGFANTLICGAIDLIAGFLPSTPESFKIGSIISSLSSQMPSVGCSVVVAIFQLISTMFGIALAIKIYKLIPFKMS